MLLNKITALISNEKSSARIKIHFKCKVTLDFKNTVWEKNVKMSNEFLILFMLKWPYFRYIRLKNLSKTILPVSFHAFKNVVNRKTDKA